MSDRLPPMQESVLKKLLELEEVYAHDAKFVSKEFCTLFPVNLSGKRSKEEEEFSKVLEELRKTGYLQYRDTVPVFLSLPGAALYFKKHNLADKKNQNNVLWDVVKILIGAAIGYLVGISQCK